MNLFKSIPDNFFGLLVLEHKETYIEALLLISKIYKEQNAELTKTEAMAALISFYDKKLYDLLDSEEITESSNNQMGALASKVLGKFTKYGWLTEENVPKELEVYIKIPFYASRFIETIKQFTEPQYDNSVNFSLSVYLNIGRIGDVNEPDYLPFLENAFRDTSNLLNILYETFDTMKRFYEGLLNQASVDKVLKEHFEDYVENVVDKRFHPFLTEKNTLIYRQKIIEKISDIEYNADILNNLNMNAKSRYGVEEEDAEIKISDMLNYIKVSFENVNDIRNRLMKQHSQYVKVTLEKINYLTHRDDNIKDNIFSLLQLVIGHQQVLMHILDKNIKLNDFSTMDYRSLYKIRASKKEFNPCDNIIYETDDEENKRNLIKERERLKNVNPIYSRSSIEKFIEFLLTDKNEFNTENIQIDNDTNYIKLVFALNYTGKVGAKYTSECLEGIVKSGIYTYPKIIFRRKAKN